MNWNGQGVGQSKKEKVEDRINQKKNSLHCRKDCVFGESSETSWAVNL